VRFDLVKRKEKTKKIICVYAIRTQFSNRVYVGSTVDYERHMQEHVKLLRRGNHHSFKLQAAFDKYGEKSFEFILCREFLSLDDALKHEKSLINFYGTKNLYNISSDCFKPRIPLKVYAYSENHKMSFLSCPEAAEFLGISDSCRITKAIRTKKTCAGYYWSQNKNDSYETLSKKPDKVFAFNKHGQLVGGYSSAKEAAKVLNCSSSLISSAISVRGRNITAAGFYWSKNKFIKLPLSKREKKVFQIFEDGTKKQWDSITTASKELGISLSSISQVLRKTSKTAKGTKWEYVEN